MKNKLSSLYTKIVYSYHPYQFPVRKSLDAAPAANDFHNIFHYHPSIIEKFTALVYFFITDFLSAIIMLLKKHT